MFSGEIDCRTVERLFTVAPDDQPGRRGLKLGWGGTSASSCNYSTSSKRRRTDASGRAGRLGRGRLARADGEQKSNDQQWKARK
jgi:hypothetical protein